MSGGSHGIDRRSFLRAGAAGLGTALAGCSRPKTASTRTEIGDYGEVVDVVEAGADPTGERSIVPVLDRVVADDTALYFAPGRYFMDEPWVHTGFSDVALIGEDATITVPDGYARHLFDAGFPDRGDVGFRFEGFEFDFTAPETLPRPLQVLVDDRLVVRDVTIRGTGGSARFDVTSADGTGVIERVARPEGGERLAGKDPVGFFVGPTSRGTLQFRDCHLGGFPNNGLYASSAKGPVHVRGGTYENSAIANVRVGGGSVVEGVTVRCTAAPAGFDNMRGIRLRNGAHALVTDCTVELDEVTYSDGAIVVEPEMETATIRNTDVRVRVNETPAIDARSPTAAVREDGSGAITCEGVTVTGDADGGAAIVVVDRDGCVFEDVRVTQTGASRDGFEAVRARDLLLRDVSIDVTGTPVVSRDATISRVGEGEE